jgi:tetratricopeptide (TPR) repeat protein
MWRAMTTPFLSSEEYDERAHVLYNEGRYDDALAILREGLVTYPAAVGLHVGLGYARLAREEIAWARLAFEHALTLDEEHEDALAGLGEVNMKLGRIEEARRLFRRTIELGYDDDLELMLQIGRALFRDGLAEDARPYFDAAVRAAPDSAEALSLVGYAQHRQGDEEAGIKTLRRALSLDPEYSEARIYLANVLYDRGDREAALYHLSRTAPDDHWDELGIWRYVELKRAIHKAPEDDASLVAWEARLVELAGEADEIDDLLAEVEATFHASEEQVARHQLELFGAMLVELRESQGPPVHHVMTRDGRRFTGTWEEIVRQMKDGTRIGGGRSVKDYMANEARLGFSLTGVVIPIADAESFIRGSADAGLLRIIG